MICGMGKMYTLLIHQEGIMGTSSASTLDLRNLLLAVEKKEPQHQLLQNIFKRHDQYSVQAVVREICEDGSNTIARLARFNTPVNYDEVVRDVAEKIGVNSSLLSWDVTRCEQLLLAELMKKYWDKLSDEERIKQYASLKNELGNEYAEYAQSLLTGGASAVLTAIQMVSSQVVRKVIIRTVSIFVARQTALSAARLALWFIPIVNVLMIAWTIIDIAGPAYRKTVPTVVEVALLRMEIELGTEN